MFNKTKYMLLIREYMDKHQNADTAAFPAGARAFAKGERGEADTLCADV